MVSESVVAEVAARWPGREAQTRELAMLMGEPHDPVPPLLLHGPAGCGKSSVLRDLLEASRAPHAIVNLTLCPTVKSMAAEIRAQLAEGGEAGGAGPGVPGGVRSAPDAHEDEHPDALRLDTPSRPARRAPAAVPAAAPAAAAGQPVTTPERAEGGAGEGGAKRAERVAMRGDGLNELRAFLSRRFGVDHAAAEAAEAAAGGGGGGAGARDGAPRAPPPPTCYVVFERAERLAELPAKRASTLVPALLSLSTLCAGANVCPVFVSRAHWAVGRALWGGAHALRAIRFSSYSEAELIGIILHAGRSGAVVGTGVGGERLAAAIRAHPAEWEHFVRAFVACAVEQTCELPVLLARAPALFETCVLPLLPAAATPTTGGGVGGGGGGTDGGVGGGGGGGPRGERAMHTLLARLRPQLKATSLALYTGSIDEGASLASAAAAASASANGARAAAPLGGAAAAAAAAAAPQRSDRLELPLQSKQLLIAAFIASRVPARHDAALFGTAIRAPRRKRARARGGGGVDPTSAAHETSAACAAPAAFPFERLLAVYGAVGQGDALPLGPPALMHLTSLADLGLISRASAPEQLDSLRFRCDAPAELVYRVAANIKFELGKYVREDSMEGAGGA